MQANRRIRRLVIVLILLVLAGIGAAGFIWLRQQDPPYRIVASGTVIPLTEDATELLKKPNAVTATELDTAVQSNYDAAFQTRFQAEAAYVVREDGQVLYAQNEHTPLYPASTTKMMTAYLALTHTEDLDALITVGELTGCYEWGSMLLGLEKGDQISMRDLLYALLMCSYNDAATAIAMEVGGDLDTFAAMMNEQLSAIGATESHFVTPHGLHDDAHYTTAYDLNLILQMAYETESLREIMMTEKTEITLIREEETIHYELQNSSLFLRKLYQVPAMEYVGGKTGNTEKAGNCLASVFDLDGTVYFSTIMKAEDASYMTAILLDYFFAPEALPAFADTSPLLGDSNT